MSNSTVSSIVRFFGPPEWLHRMDPSTDLRLRDEWFFGFNSERRWTHRGRPANLQAWLYRKLNVTGILRFYWSLWYRSAARDIRARGWKRQTQSEMVQMIAERQS